MAQLLVRNLEEEVKARLQRQAARHGISMEEEARNILRNGIQQNDVPTGGLGTEISAMFRKYGLDEPIAELRGYELKPLSFEEPPVEND